MATNPNPSCEEVVDDKNPVFEIDETEVDELVVNVPTTITVTNKTLYINDIDSFSSRR